MGRDALYAALRKVEPLLGERPERRYLRIDAGERLQLSATDRDQLVTAELTADVDRPGTVIAYGLFLIEFVHRAPEGKIVLRCTGSELRVEAPEAYIALSTFPNDVWPRLDHLQEDGVTWTAEALLQLKRVLHAVSPDAARPVLTGVGFGDGWAAATDSYRLAAVRLDLPEDANVIIPGQALEHVLRLSGGSSVLVRFAEQRVSFIVGGVTLTTTLLSGPFPDWRQAVPDPQPKAIRADRRDLLAALERIAFLAQREERCALHIEPDAAGLRIKARLPDIGHQEERIAGENTVGNVCLQARHLRSLLEQLTMDSVKLSMDEPLRPAVVREDGFVALLMPIRV